MFSLEKFYDVIYKNLLDPLDIGYFYFSGSTAPASTGLVQNQNFRLVHQRQDDRKFAPVAARKGAKLEFLIEAEFFDEIIERIKQTPWGRPECVMLLVNEEL
jgi:hypothetical protein